jgi:hypothetical protein
MSSSTGRRRPLAVGGAARCGALLGGAGREDVPAYTYFTWRSHKREIEDCLTELTETAPKDFFRPNFFVYTPDINPHFPQTSGRPGFLIRAALTTTPSGLWGMYNGFELCEGARSPARRSTSTARSARSAPGTGTAPATSRPRSRGGTRYAGRPRRCRRGSASPSTTPSTTACCGTARRRRTARRSCSSRSRSPTGSSATACRSPTSRRTRRACS